MKWERERKKEMISTDKNISKRKWNKIIRTINVKQNSAWTASQLTLNLNATPKLIHGSLTKQTKGYLKWVKMYQRWTE